MSKFFFDVQGSVFSDKLPAEFSQLHGIVTCVSKVFSKVTIIWDIDNTQSSHAYHDIRLEDDSLPTQFFPNPPTIPTETSETSVTSATTPIVKKEKTPQHPASSLAQELPNSSPALPVEIFEMLFNSDLQNHIVSESVLYASQQNKSDFSLSVNDLKTFVAGNHFLPQQKLYWERNRDVSVPMVFQSISKNRFVEIFNCCSQE